MFHVVNSDQRSVMVKVDEIAMVDLKPRDIWPSTRYESKFAVVLKGGYSEEFYYTTSGEAHKELYMLIEAITHQYAGKGGTK